ncbi:hypothetical protein GOV09_05100 [Candidatus Woesearchaeota archaeon]|nr:hypothetical protein [Candidatus Woesearchaeota archaeon]
MVARQYTKAYFLDNVLMRTLARAKYDTLWAVIEKRGQGMMPQPREMVVGKLDQHGGSFIPGALLPLDLQEKLEPRASKYGRNLVRSFSSAVLRSLERDNALVFFPDRYIDGVLLDTYHFLGKAEDIIGLSEASGRMTAKSTEADVVMRYVTDPEIKQTADNGSKPRVFLLEEVGAKIQLAAGLGVCLAERGQYGVLIKNKQLTIDPLVSEGITLAQDCAVFYHQTRYGLDWVGAIKIMFGGIGEFAKLTFEPITPKMEEEHSTLQNKSSRKRHLVAQYDDREVVMVLRIYRPGDSSKPVVDKAHIIDPGEELGLDLETLTEEALEERYKLVDREKIMHPVLTQ